MIVLEVEGIQYAAFTKANVQLRLDALSNTFSFDATAANASPLPFKGGQACKVYADGELILTGHIELLSVSYDSGQHTISFQGRDRTSDLLDSSLAGLTLKAPITLATLCRRVIKHLGSDLTVVDDANAKPFKQAEDIASPDPGENAFTFLEKYSRKRQVLLSSTPEGNLWLTQSSGVNTGGSVIHRIGNPGNANNVIRSDMTYDTTGRFNLYRSVSQLNTSAGALAGILAAASVADQGTKNTATDDEVRKGRQLILVSEASLSGKDTLDRATWEANIRKARGKVYSADVSGFRDQEGNLWKLNTLPQVIDEFADIEARMLVNTISFSNSLSDGNAGVTLGFVESNAYKLTLLEPVEEKLGKGVFALPS